MRLRRARFPRPVRGAWEEITSHRSRFLLAVLSVVIGVWSVTVVVTAGDVARAAVTQALEETLGRPATISLSVTDMASGSTRATWDGVMQGLMTRLDITQWSPNDSVTAGVKTSDVQGSMQLDGVIPQLAGVRLLPVIAGRWLVSSDADSMAPDMVLNEQGVNVLGFSSDDAAIGARVTLLTLQGSTARIVGVVHEPSQDAATAYLSAAALDRLGAPVGSHASVGYVMRVLPAEVDGVITFVKFDLGAHGLGGDFTLQRIDDEQTVDSALIVIQVVLAGIAGVSLVTGGIGVLNLGLISVRERLHELAIRRAFGATRGYVFTMVLTEATLTTVLAGLVGIVLGVGTIAALQGVLGGVAGGGQAGFAVPVAAPLAGLVLAALTGGIAGFLPAMRASSVTLVAALRSQ
jgi:putative ABC transport system permease protein